jgi:hypothetical protein
VRPAAPSKLTLEQAYEASYLWLFHIDQAPNRVDEQPPEMVELISEELVTWVRAGTEVTQKGIIAFLGVDAEDRKRAIISAAGFSPGAISIGESQGVALFSLGPDGSVRPETGHAIMMMPAEAPPPPFSIQMDADTDDGRPKWGTTKFDEDVWVDCPGCGTNQHISLKSCRVCGTKLVEESANGPTSTEVVYECRMCGSHDIAVLEGGASAGEPDRDVSANSGYDKFDQRR